MKKKLFALLTLAIAAIGWHSLLRPTITTLHALDLAQPQALRAWGNIVNEPCTGTGGVRYVPRDDDLPQVEGSQVVPRVGGKGGRDTCNDRSGAAHPPRGQKG